MNPLDIIPEVIRKAYECGFVDGSLRSLLKVADEADSAFDPRHEIDEGWGKSKAKELAAIYEPVGKVT